MASSEGSRLISAMNEPGAGGGIENSPWPDSGAAASVASDWGSCTDVDTSGRKLAKRTWREGRWAAKISLGSIAADSAGSDASSGTGKEANEEGGMAKTEFVGNVGSELAWMKRIHKTDGNS